MTNKCVPAEIRPTTTPNMAAADYLEAQDKLRAAQHAMYDARYELAKSLVKYEMYHLLKVDDTAVRRAVARGDL